MKASGGDREVETVRGGGRGGGGREGRRRSVERRVMVVVMIQALALQEIFGVK
jgi:hypothetical protein